MAQPFKIVLPYLIGVAVAPLIGMITKPLIRGAIKTTIKISLEVKKLAAEAAEDLQDLAAEASAEFVTAKTKSGVSATALQEHLDGEMRR